MKLQVEADASVKKLLYHDDKNVLVTVTTTMMLTLHSVSAEGDTTETMKVGFIGSQWYSGSTLACGARGPRFKSRCGLKFVFSRKSLRYAALGTGCILTAVPRSTQPSTV